MMRSLPRPVSAVEQYLAAVVDRLDQLNATLTELSGRLEPSDQPPADEEEGTVRLLEPDPLPATEPVRLREPEIPEPPRRGRGSGRDEWAAYADLIGVRYPPNARQGDIIAAVEDARAAKRAS